MCILMPLASDFITIVQTCPLRHGSFAIVVNMCYTHLSIKPNPKKNPEGISKENYVFGFFIFAFSMQNKNLAYVSVEQKNNLFFQIFCADM